MEKVMHYVALHEPLLPSRMNPSDKDFHQAAPRIQSSALIVLIRHLPIFWIITQALLSCLIMVLWMTSTPYSLLTKLLRPDLLTVDEQL